MGFTPCSSLDKRLTVVFEHSLLRVLEIYALENVVFCIALEKVGGPPSYTTPLLLF